MNRKQYDLTPNTLRGLLADFIHSTVKPGVYFFKEYVLLVKKRSDVSLKEMRKYGLKIPKSTTYYHTMKALHRCGMCGSQHLSINRDGTEGVLCNDCRRKKEERRQK